MSISGLLDTSRRALNAQTQSIRVVGDNIANVNTPGYTRRRADLVTEPPQSGRLEVGSGVEVKTITRIVDQFINGELIARKSDRAFYDIRSEILNRAEAPFALDGQPGRIGYELSAFNSALLDLATNPADIPLRTQVLQKGRDLVTAIRETYNQVAALQREANDRTGLLVEDVNRLSGAIAAVNQEIVNAEYSSQLALTLRDQRDQLMRELGELVSFQSVENPDGSNLIYLSNGFALVNGTTNRELEFLNNPSFVQPPNPAAPPGLDGSPLGYIVYDFGGGSHSDLTNVIRNGGGEIGGLLSLRGSYPNGATSPFDASGDLVEIAAYVELIARDLLVNVNTEYLGPDVDAAGGFQPSARTLDGNNPTQVGQVNSVFALFGFEGMAADYGGADGLPTAADLLASNETSFANILTFNVTNERDIAAARDTDTTAATAYSQGDAANISNYTAGVLTGGIAATLTGERNYNLGPVSLTNTTLEGLYNSTVSTAGRLSARAADDFQIYEAREAQVAELQSSISGVSLDEEFAKLINFQRGFEAAARMIRVGDELFAQILNLLG